MPHELLRLPCPHAEIVLLEYPADRYQIDIYWRQGGYYEKLVEAYNGAAARELLRATEICIRALAF